MMTREQENYVSDLCNSFDGAPVESWQLTADRFGPYVVIAPDGEKTIVDADGDALPVHPLVEISRKEL